MILKYYNFVKNVAKNVGNSQYYNCFESETEVFQCLVYVICGENFYYTTKF